MFDEWLLSTRSLQRQSFGKDPALLEGAELAEYVRWNMLAANDELMEALHEVDWKPWTVTEDGFRNRDAFVGELVDVLHFVANMLVAAGCDDAELTDKYQAKQQKNRDRMASKIYDGRNKCKFCGAAFDDEATKCTPGESFSTTVEEHGYASGGQRSPICAKTFLWNLNTDVGSTNIYVDERLTHRGNLTNGNS